MKRKSLMFLTIMAIFLSFGCGTPKNDGGNDADYLDNENDADVEEIEIQNKTWSQISAGAYYACAVDTEGSVYCWGHNYDSFVPAPIDTSGVLKDKEIVSVSSGNNTACALDSEGVVYCWGWNKSGQLGDGTQSDSSVPVEVDTTGVLKDKKIISISVGGGYLEEYSNEETAHACVIDSEGTAYCWGGNEIGQIGNNTQSDSSVPVKVDTAGVMSGKKLKSISAGAFHSCAIDIEGKAYCWGWNGYGQLGIETKAETEEEAEEEFSNVPVSVDTTGVMNGKKLESISAGTFHTCAIDIEGAVYCWGYYYYLGNGDLTPGADINRVFLPVKVDISGVLKDRKLVAVDTDDSHTCAVDIEGKSYCWGEGGRGQLGDGTKWTVISKNRLLPVEVNIDGVLKGKKLISITVGNEFSCALDSNGKSYCWGNGELGQFGNGVESYSSVPEGVDKSGVLKNKKLISIATGDSHTCAVDSEGKTYCWGYNGAGQLGDGIITQMGSDSFLPLSVDDSALENKEFFEIGAGVAHTCALNSNNKVYCWGYSYYGQLGNGSAAVEDESPVLPEDAYVYFSPFEVDTSGKLSGKKIISIDLGDYHTCALDSDGEAYCWGYNKYGQLGNGDFADHCTTPARVDTTGVINDRELIYISAGVDHTCAVDSEGAVYCWGKNNYGQLGDGAQSDNRIPVKVDKSGVMNGRELISASAGGLHSCAVDRDGFVYCWGNNNYGQLGDGTAADSDVPVNVDTKGVLKDKKILAVSAGYYNTCAVDNEGKSYCWGYKNHGQIGRTADLDFSNVPVSVDTTGVMSGKKIVLIAAGHEHSCAVDSEGDAYCWGLREDGRLGDGKYIQSFVPVEAAQSY